MLLEKAVEHLPQLVEVATHLSRIAFVAEAGEESEKLRKRVASVSESEDGYWLMQVGTNGLPFRVRELTDSKSWPHLITFLKEELPLLMNAGNVPKDLLRDIQGSRDYLIRELESLGFKSLPVMPMRGGRN